MIDTDIIIYSIKGDQTVHKNFIVNEEYPKVITYGELLFGARKSKSVEKNLAVIYRIRDLFSVRYIDNAVSVA